MNNTSVAMSRKRRKKVIVSRWKLNSSSMNKSGISLSFNKGKYMLLQKRNEALQMNNKDLAMALQDARCKLAEKEQILNDATVNSKNIKEARKKMVEMDVVLQSFMKNFNDTLLLLQANDTKISSFRTPFPSCTKFEKKMQDLTESVDEFLEENLALSEQGAKCDKITKKFSNLMIPKKQTSNKDCTPIEISDEAVDKTIRSVNKALHNNPLQVPLEKVPIDNSKNAEVDPVPSVSHFENSEGIIDQNKETGVNDEISGLSLEGTPKLIIPDLKPLLLKKTFNSETSLLNENSPSLVTNPKKVPNFPAISSQKIKSSKIPRLHFRHMKRNNAKSSRDVVNKIKISFQNIVNDKTLVAKNSNNLDITPESTNALNQENVLNENSSDIDYSSQKINRRKTFVISSSSSENTEKSTRDRRKTFVKKAEDKIKTGKSTRKTFVIREQDKNSVNDCEDVQEKSCLPGSIVEPTEMLPSICLSPLTPLSGFHSPSKKTFIEVNDCISEVKEVSEKKGNNYAKISLSVGEKKKRRVTFSNDQNKNIETFSETKITPPENSYQELLSEIENKSKEINEGTSRVKKSQICEDNSITNNEKNNFRAEKSAVRIDSNNVKKMAEISIDKDLMLPQNTDRDYTNKLSEEIVNVSKLKQSQCEECCNNTEFVDGSSTKRKNINRHETCNSKDLKTVTNFCETNCPKSTPAIKNILELKESKLEVINKPDNGIFKDEKQNKKETSKSNLRDNTELLKFDSACESSIQKAIQNDDEDIEILNENVYRKPKVSYKMFLESSDSDCESISELNLPNFNDKVPKKSIPIRGKVSYSKKQKKYVFGSHKEKSMPQKRSLRKYSPKSEEDKINTCENQIKENIRENNADLVSEVYKKETAYVIDSDRQIKMLSPPTGVKNAENLENNKYLDKNHDTQSFNFTNCKKDKDMKNVLYNKYSPVIALDSSLNMIETDIEHLELSSKNLSSKPTVINSSEDTKSNEKSNNRARKKDKVSKHPSKENIPVDTISMKQNLNKKKLKKKEKVSDLGKENVSDLLKIKSDVKSKKQNNRKKTPTDISDVNSIVVQAEVHPLPQSLNALETSIKEEECKLKNLQVAVVLNDIFQSKDNTFSSNNKKIIITEGGHFPLTEIFTENSGKVLVSIENNPEVKNEEIANGNQELRTRKRNQRPNYAEPKLNKKMRR